MDTGVLAAIIGGLAAVLGGAMAVIAILASRAMKTAEAQQHQNSEADEQPAESPAATAESGSDDDPNVFVDPFSTDESTNSENVFTDPFAKTTGDEDDSLEWGSAFDDPAVNPDEQWGLDADDDAKHGEYDPLKPGPENNEGT
ncbi:MAG: hypothetical protein ACR2OU_11740 [Thermomicrobiales bacterium]